MAYWISQPYKPFDDSEVAPRKNVSASNYDLSSVTTQLQGVEIKIQSEMYGSTQPKMFGGYVDKFGRVIHEDRDQRQTYGEKPTFNEFFVTSSFLDKPKFDSGEFVEQGNSYPLPILLSEGPQSIEEAVIEVFSTPFRFPENQAPFLTRRVVGGLEYGGNDFDDYATRASSIAEGYVEYADPSITRPFLDEGERIYINDVNSGSIRFPGYTSLAQRIIKPFIDTENRDIYKDRLTTASNSFLSASMELGGIENNFELQPRQKKSATAGTVVYGRDASVYGTDSIVFAGMTRGS